MVRETWPHGCFSRASCARRFVLETCQVTLPVWLGMHVINKCCGCSMRAVGCELVMEEGRGGGRLPLEKALSLGRPVILGSFRGEGGPQRVVGVEAYSSPEMFFWRWLSISPIPHPHPSPISIPIPTRWYGEPGPFLLRIDRSGFNLSWHVFPRRVPSLHQQQHQSRVPRRWMPW